VEQEVFLASLATLRETILAGPMENGVWNDFNPRRQGAKISSCRQQWYTKRDRRRTGSFHKGGNQSVGRRSIKRGPGKRQMDGKDFHLADEIRYIQQRAAEHAGRFVTVGPLALFSTETGDAWLLEPKDHLAARLAKDGDPEDLYFEETHVSYAINWKGNYRIEGSAFVYLDKASGRIVTILGYPTQRIAEWG
jgi:hypothetical protein